MGLSSGIQTGIMDKIEKQGYSESKLIADDVLPCAMRCISTSGQSFPGVATPALVEWDTKEYDPFVMMDLSTELCTVPMGGYYNLNAGIGIQTGTVIGATIARLAIRINGTDALFAQRHELFKPIPVQVGSILELDEDDVISVYFQWQFGSGTNGVLTTTYGYNWFNVARVRG